MQLNGWLVYTKEDYERNSAFAQRFLDLGNNNRSTIRLIYKDDIYYGTYHNTLCILDRDGSPMSTPDFVINRSIDPLFSRHLENMNVRVYNSGRVAEICNDKARTYLEVSRLGIPMVDTLFIDKKALLDGKFRFEYPIVIKTVDGRSGKEVFLAESENDVIDIVSKIPKERFVAQRLCSKPGRDVRVFVVGKNIVGAALRQSKVNFKANISLGGFAEPYFLNEKEKGYVNKIAEHFDFGMVGIDFIFDENGDFLFNEIEDVAGSRTLSMTSNADIVKLYLEHIYSAFD